MRCLPWIILRVSLIILLSTFNLVRLSEGQISDHVQESFISSPTFALIILLVIALGSITIVYITLTMTKKRKKSDALPHRSCPDNNCLSTSSVSEPQGLPIAELRDISNATGKESFRVKIPTTRIGRNVKSDIIIPEETISTNHATIDYRKGYYYLIDNRSSNGTFLNGSKVSSRIKLKSGDLIAFDNYKFQFVIPTLKIDHLQLNSAATLLRPDPSHLKS